MATAGRDELDGCDFLRCLLSTQYTDGRTLLDAGRSRGLVIQDNYSSQCEGIFVQTVGITCSDKEVSNNDEA